jgi:hypothetical protein
MSDTAVRITASLDTEWVKAEQALGEYWRIRSLVEVKDGWEVVATDGNRLRTAMGPTPLAAIRSLRGGSDED